MLTQQEFDAACVRMKVERRQLAVNFRIERLEAKRALEQKVASCNVRRDAAMRQYRDAVYDIATMNSPASSGFIAGMAEAKNVRDAAISLIDQEQQRANDEYFAKMQDYAKLQTEATCAMELRKSEIIKEYNEWLEVRRANKADGRQEGGEQ